MKKAILLFIFLLGASLSIYSQTATVIARNANLRGTPSTKGKIVDTLPNTMIVKVIKQKGVWFLVQSIDYVGWIHGNTIKLDKDNSSIYESNVSPPSAPARRVTKPRKRTRTRAIRRYIRGSRGGCYYINRNGNKTYISRSLCN